MVLFPIAVVQAFATDTVMIKRECLQTNDFTEAPVAQYSY
jgi:hypothetical protein